jgi:hypothetical protein
MKGFIDRNATVANDDRGGGAHRLGGLGGSDASVGIGKYGEMAA